MSDKRVATRPLEMRQAKAISRLKQNLERQKEQIEGFVCQFTADCHPMEQRFFAVEANTNEGLGDDIITVDISFIDVLNAPRRLRLTEQQADELASEILNALCETRERRTSVGGNDIPASNRGNPFVQA